MTKIEDQPTPQSNDSPSIHDLVVADVLDRKALGLERYGSLLQADNGRDVLVDAYQEALDLACYLRQAIEERENRKKMSWTPEFIRRLAREYGISQ